MRKIKGKPFEPAVYFEGLRQTRIAGIVYLVLIGVFVLFELMNLVRNNMDHYVIRSTVTEILRQNPFSAILCRGVAVVFAAILPLILFHFLDKRGACDIYHALPHTRVSLFTGFFAAIMTWIVSGVVVYCILTAMVILIADPSIYANSSNVLGEFLRYFIDVLIPVLCVAGIVLFCTCVTGTVLTNLVSSSILLFVPSLMHLMIASTMVEFIPLLSRTHMPGFMSYDYNLLYRMVGIGYMGGDDNLLSDLFFVVLGVALIAGALFAFVTRKSESAGKASVNRVLQTVFRLLFAMLMCIIPSMFLLEGMFSGNDYGYDSGRSMAIFCFYIAAIVAYFLYELVTTRKASNLIKAIPGVILLVLMNVAYVGGVAGYRGFVMDNIPDAEDIRSVTFSQEYYGVNESGGFFDFPYENAEVRTIAADALKSTRPYGAYGYPGGQFCELKLRLRSRTIYRRACFSQSQMERLYELGLEENLAWYRSITELPAVENVKLSIQGESVNVLTVSQRRELYTLLREELKEKPAGALASYMQGYMSRNGIEQYIRYNVNLLVEYRENGNDRTLNLPITDFVPKTLQKYIEISNGANKWDITETMLDRILNDSVYGYWNLNIHGYGIDKENYGLSWYYDNENSYWSHDFITKVRDTISTEEGRKVDVSKPHYYIYGNVGSEYICFYVNCDTVPDNG